MDSSLRNLAEFISIVQKTSHAKFQDAYPNAFLVYACGPNSGGVDPLEFTTAKLRRDQMFPSLSTLLRDKGDTKVFQVSKQSSHAFEGMVTVGRTNNNDIVLPYSSISKFHAFFVNKADDGHYELTDADSTNGTFVNQEKLEPDCAHQVVEGDIITFSPSVELTFHSSDGFYFWITDLLENYRAK